MKQVSHKIMSLALAFVVLISTTSFTFNMHYCGGTLVETAVFKKVKGCGMDMDKPATEGCSIAKKSCCKDEVVIVEGQDELKIAFDKISFEQQIFVALFAYSYSTLFEGTASEKIPSFDYRPPLVKRDVQVLHQTFLI